MKNFYKNAFRFLVWLWLSDDDIVIPDDDCDRWPVRLCCCHCRCNNVRRVVFSSVRVGGNITVKGEIKKVKAEIGQYVDVVATPVGGNGFQAGTENFSVSAVNDAGEDVSSQVVQSATPGQESNPLAQRFTHDGGAECVATVVFRADGDRDIDEEAEIVGTLVIVFDEKNVTAVELTGTAGNPEPGTGEPGGGTEAEPVV